jgi:hypothetical protein
MQLTELNYSSVKTNFAFRKDNSLALQASSTENLKLNSEVYKFEITLTAESLGLGKSAFVDPTKPIVINLHFCQSQLQVSHKISIKEIKTIRPPQEIIQDLVQALTDVMQDPGNKSVSYVLDSEAVQSLIQSDSKMAKLFSELVMVMASINLMKRLNESSNDYVIFLSGKGQPYLDVKEEVDAEGIFQSYEFKISILPPHTETPPSVPEINTPESGRVIVAQDAATIPV